VLPYVYIYSAICTCTLSYCCPVSVKSNSLLPPPNHPVASVSYVLLFSWPDIISALSRAVYVYRKEAWILTCNQHTTIIIQTYYPTICLKWIYFPSSFWIIITGFQFLLLMKRCKFFTISITATFSFFLTFPVLTALIFLKLQLPPIPSKEFEPWHL
jgi:hypothetical protein